jgi:hypothetical protein
MNRVRIHCNSCGTETWHALAAETRVTRYASLWGYEQLIEAAILQCCGCDDFSFRSITYFFEFQDEKDKPEEKLFPDRSFKKRRRKFLPMPVHITRLYQETITAHDAKLTLLTATGLRSLVEAAVVDKIEKASMDELWSQKSQPLREFLTMASLLFYKSSEKWEIRRSMLKWNQTTWIFIAPSMWLKDSSSIFTASRTARTLSRNGKQSQSSSVYPRRKRLKMMSNWQFNADANTDQAFGIFMASVGALRAWCYGAGQPGRWAPH